MALVVLPIGAFFSQSYFNLNNDSRWTLVQRKYELRDAITEEELTHLDRPFGEAALIVTFISSYVLYVVCHVAVTVMNAPETASPARYFQTFVPVLITGCALSFLAFLVVRYCAYMRLLHYLWEIVEKFSYTESLLRGPATNSQQQHMEQQHRRRSQIGTFRKCVFRDEAWFEPPGNVFVTVGIAATFLGLASGLATLNFHELFYHLENLNDASDKGMHARNALAGFVRYMGLGIGVSVIGVILAIASQYLRGIASAPIATEEVLKSAERIVETGIYRPPPLDLNAISDRLDKLAGAIERTFTKP